MGVPSRTATSSTGREDGPGMPRGENQNDIEDAEGQVVDGNRIVLTSPTTNDEQASTVEEALQVDAYVVGEEPSGEQRKPATAPPIEATVLQNETQVDARIWWFVRGLVVVAMALSIALPLTLRDNNNAEQVESPSPTPAPELKDSWLILQPIIGNELKDGRYEQEAYQWLTKYDQSGILDDPYTPEWRIVQRFVLANFYFATNGTGWSNQLRFLFQDDECTWKETIPYDDYQGSSFDGLNVTSLPAGVIKCDTEGRVQSLRIAQNGLQNAIPSALRYLSDLKELSFETNPFDLSPMPSWLAELTGLDVLDFTRCSLSGTIATTFPAELRILALYDNLLTGTLPSEIGRLSNLTYIDLAMNELAGTLPEAWNRLSHLEVIYLWHNILTGTLPKSWSQWTALLDFELDQNALSGTLPNAWSEWSNVGIVHLYNNNLTGTLPDSWSHWTALSWLVLGSNLLTGTLPNGWSKLTSLEYVWLYDNYLTGTLPNFWSQCTSLSQLDLSENALTGALPDSWSQLTSVEYVWLFNNYLTASLPESWSQWSALSILSMEGNLFTGTLPNVWSQLTNLEYVWLNTSYLTGTLPESYDSWTNIRFIDFSANFIQGTIPGSWSQLTNLEYIWLSDNYLTGTLPESYASWKNILAADFSANCLDGTIPLEYEVEWTSFGTIPLEYEGLGLEMNFSDVFGIQREDCRVGNRTRT